MPRTLAVRRAPLAGSVLLAILLAALTPLLHSAARADDAQSGAAQDDQHVVVATVFDQPIYLESLTPHESVVEGYRKTLNDDKKLDEWLETQRSRVLRELVFRLLSNAYMQENGITVSEDEINAFLKKEKEVYQSVLDQYAKDLKQYQFQAEQVNATGKPVPKELTDKIKMTENKIDVLERKNPDNMLISEKQRRLHDEVERQRVAKAIRAWKFNKLLHDQFGGRVVRADLTYEPYEAYAAWLQTQEELGHFKITDERLNADFWAFYNREPKDPIEPFDGMWDKLRWSDSGMP